MEVPSNLAAQRHFVCRCPRSELPRTRKLRHTERTPPVTSRQQPAGHNFVTPVPRPGRLWITPPAVWITPASLWTSAGGTVDRHGPAVDEPRRSLCPIHSCRVPPWTRQRVTHSQPQGSVPW